MTFKVVFQACSTKYIDFTQPYTNKMCYSISEAKYNDNLNAINSLI